MRSNSRNFPKYCLLLAGTVSSLSLLTAWHGPAGAETAADPIEMNGSVGRPVAETTVLTLSEAAWVSATAPLPLQFARATDLADIPVPAGLGTPVAEAPRIQAHTNPPPLPTLRPELGRSSDTGERRVASLQALSKVALDALQAPAASQPAVFGSVPFRTSGLAVSQRWQRVIDDMPAGGNGHINCVDLADGCEDAGQQRIGELLERAREADPAERLRIVNRGVNRLLRYVDDELQYGSQDFWASASDSLRRGAGDCEDYAIAKMALLQKLGVSPRNMYLVVLRELRRKLDHAVLVVTLNGENLVLDNLYDDVRPDTALRRYRPVYSLNGMGDTWVHAFTLPQERRHVGRHGQEMAARSGAARPAARGGDGV